MNITYNYVSAMNIPDSRKIFMSVKGIENIAKDRNYSTGTELISVHSRAERTNNCVTDIFLYDARAYTSFYW